MTPPATDRGLSEADWGLINRVFEGLKPVPYGEARASLTPFNTTEGFISALLAAARREGEGAARDHDHSTEKATPQERASLEEMRRLFFPTAAQRAFGRRVIKAHLSVAKCDAFVEALEAASARGGA